MNRKITFIFVCMLFIFGSLTSASIIQRMPEKKDTATIEHLSPCYEYIPGDVNGDGQVIGSDVTFLVNYFRCLATPPFEVDGFYPAADVNGDCQIIGSDVTYLVNYFRGMNQLQWCSLYPPCPNP